MGHTAWIRVARKKSLVSSNIFESAWGSREDDSTRVRMWVFTVGLRLVLDLWDCYICKRTLMVSTDAEGQKKQEGDRGMGLRQDGVL